MPKRTREKKIVSQLKRLQNAQNPSVTQTPTTPSQTISLKNLAPTTDTTSVTKAVSENYDYVKKDLRKTVIFAVVAIVLEVVLSLTASEVYATLISRLG